MAMYAVYSDESGTHSQSKTLVIAGKIATAGAWIAFSKEWQAALKQYGLKDFHMKCAESPDCKDFRQFDQTQRWKIIRHFAEILARHQQFGHSNHVNFQVWRNIVDEFVKKPNYKKTREYHTDPYNLAYGMALRSIVGLCDHLGIAKSDVDIFFAELQGCNKYLTKYATFAGKLGLNRPSFGRAKPPNAMLPLQGADMYAWFMNKYISDQNKYGTNVKIAHRHQPIYWSGNIGNGNTRQLDSAQLKMIRKDVARMFSAPAIIAGELRY